MSWEWDNGIGNKVWIFSHDIREGVGNLILIDKDESDNEDSVVQWLVLNVKNTWIWN